MLVAELGVLGEQARAARELVKYSRGRYPIQPVRNPLDRQLPHLAQARNVGHLLRLDATVAIGNGDVSAVLDRLRAMRNVARSIGDEPFVESQFARKFSTESRIQVLERLLSQQVLTAEVLREIGQELAEDEKDEFNAQHKALRGDRADGVAVEELIATGKFSWDSQLQGRSLLASANEFVFRRPVTVDDRVSVLKKRTIVVNAHALPPAERRAELARLRWEFPERQGITALEATLASWQFDQEDRSVALLRCTRTALAIEVYRLEHDHWPASLADLPEKVAALRDSFTGEPLRYKPTEKGVVTYSVGPNRGDNGGQLNRENMSKNADDVGFELWHPSHRRQSEGLP